MYAPLNIKGDKAGQSKNMNYNRRALINFRPN